EGVPYRHTTRTIPRNRNATEGVPYRHTTRTIPRNRNATEGVPYRQHPRETVPGELIFTAGKRNRIEERVFPCHSFQGFHHAVHATLNHGAGRAAVPATAHRHFRSSRRGQDHPVDHVLSSSGRRTLAWTGPGR